MINILLEYVMKKKIIVIVLILTTLLSYLVIISGGHQRIVVHLTDINGSPLENMFVQGILPLPPSLDGGLETVFLGRTDSNGFLVVDNTSLIRLIMDEWVKYQGFNKARLSTPNILLFITYNSSGEIYFTESSIKIASIEILNGESYSEDIVIDVAKMSRLHIAGVEKIVSLNSSSSNLNTFGNGFSSLYGLLGSKPYEDNPEYFEWIKVDSDVWPQNGYGRIPISYINASSASYGYISCSIYSTSSIKFNVGYALDIYSSSISYRAGGNLWSASAVFGNTYIVYPNGGGAGYIYILGRVEGALYQMTYRTVDQLIYYDEYQYDVAVIDVQVDDNGHILGGNDIGLPPQISDILDGYSELLYDSELGTGSSQPAYTVYSIDFVNTIAAGDTSWINIGLPLGSIIAWAFGPEAAIPTDILINIAGSISSSSLTFSLSYAGYDALSNYMVYLYIRVGEVEYLMSNGLNGHIPLMAIRLYAYPNYPGGPH